MKKAAHDAITCFKVIYDEKKSAKVQTSLTQDFNKNWDVYYMIFFLLNCPNNLHDVFLFTRYAALPRAVSIQRECA